MALETHHGLFQKPKIIHLMLEIFFPIAYSLENPYTSPSHMYTAHVVSEVAFVISPLNRGLAAIPQCLAVSGPCGTWQVPGFY